MRLLAALTVTALLLAAAGTLLLVAERAGTGSSPAEDGRPPSDAAPPPREERRDRRRAQAPVPPRGASTRTAVPSDPVAAALANVAGLRTGGRPLEALEALRALCDDAPDLAATPAVVELMRLLEEETLVWFRREEAGFAAADRPGLIARVTAAVTDPALRRDLLEALVTVAGDVTVGEQMVVRAGGSEADRAALAAHLVRFGPDLDGVPRAALEPSALDRHLEAVRRRTRTPRQTAHPLQIADPVQSEIQRLDQLERLRQRDAVGLLGHIESGLAWLALHQADDGRIGDVTAAARCKVLGHWPCTSKGVKYEQAATSLAILAFLDFRDQDAQGIFEPSLAAAVRWLLGQQKADGSFESDGYHAGIALMALGQAAASSGDQEVRSAVERGWAHYFPLRGKGGGYRYGARQAGDLSATGWYVQAYEVARDAGATLPETLPDTLEEFVRSCWDGGVRFSYMPKAGARPTLEPVGMLCLLILDEEEGEAERETWTKHLAEVDRGKALNLYTLYYDVRVELALAGDLTDGRRQALFDVAETVQVAVGSAAGMFDTGGKRSARPADARGTDRWMDRGGPVVLTAFCVLTLEHALFRR